MWFVFFLLKVHSNCKDQISSVCPLGQCKLSILPPTAINNIDSDGYWEATRPPRTSPLLVFVNTKSGDNQVKAQKGMGEGGSNSDNFYLYFKVFEKCNLK